MDNQDNTSLSLNPSPTRTDAPAHSEQPASTLPTVPPPLTFRAFWYSKTPYPHVLQNSANSFWSTKSPDPHVLPNSANSMACTLSVRRPIADEKPRKLRENYKSVKKDLFPIMEPLSTLSGEEAVLRLFMIEDPMVYAAKEAYLAVTVLVFDTAVSLEKAKEVAVKMKACLDGYGLEDIEVAMMECGPSWKESEDARARYMANNSLSDLEEDYSSDSSWK